MKIKGNFLKDYVKTVRETPELAWDRFLTAEDWEIVRGQVIPLSWYPVETMGRIGRGLFELRTQGKYELVRLHGRTRVDTLFDEGTRNFLIKGSPIDSLRAFSVIARRYVDEIEVKPGKKESNYFELSWWPVDGVLSWDLFREIQAGTMERLVELNGGKNARAEFRGEQVNGREACIICLRWE